MAAIMSSLFLNNVPARLEEGPDEIIRVRHLPGGKGEHYLLDLLLIEISINPIAALVTKSLLVELYRAMQLHSLMVVQVRVKLKLC